MWKRVVGYGALLAAGTLALQSTIGVRFTYRCEKVNVTPILLENV